MGYTRQSPTIAILYCSSKTAWHIPQAASTAPDMSPSPFILFRLEYQFPTYRLNVFLNTSDEYTPTMYFCQAPGGDEGTRTPDLLRAREALSHLSYIPRHGGPAWTRTRDPALIRGVL